MEKVAVYLGIVRLTMEGIPKVMEGDGVRGWFDELLHAGMPHHVTVFQGHHEDLFRRFARGAGVGWVA